jgi:hypothetical protein
MQMANTSPFPYGSWPSIGLATTRHLHTTFRVKKVRELFSAPAERERALETLGSAAVIKTSKTTSSAWAGVDRHEE